MKIPNLLPILAALIGFAVAWVVKPTPPAASTDGGSPAAAPTAGPRTRSAGDRSDASTAKRTEEVRAEDFPLAELAEKGPKTRIEAKMNRLREALGLSLDQETRIIAAVESARASASDQVPVIEDLAGRGRTLLETLRSILTPEQMAAFEEIRARERENLIEARAQNRISKVISEIDLSPGQRDEVMARLRQYEKTEVQEIPAAATLLLNTSVLPTEPTDPTIDGVLALNMMAEAPPHPDDMAAAHQALITRQRAELEDQLECFDGILTAGQMGQYHAIIAEIDTIMREVQRNTLLPPSSLETDPEKLYGKPAPDPRSEENEDPLEEEEIEPEDEIEEDSAGRPVQP